MALETSRSSEKIYLVVNRCVQVGQPFSVVLGCEVVTSLVNLNLTVEGCLVIWVPDMSFPPVIEARRLTGRFCQRFHPRLVAHELDP